MNELRGKRVLILQQRTWGITIGQPLAIKLHSEGCRLAALTLKRTTHDFILKQKDVPYDLIINNDEIMDEPKKFLGDTPPSLKRICEDLGIDSIWPIVMSLRNHVRSYKDKYYYSFKQNVPDEEIIQYVQATYLYISRIFQEFKPDIILTPNFVALPHIMLNLYAKRRGIKMIGVTDAKVKGQFMFTYSYQDNEGPLFERLKELNEGRVESQNREKAKAYIAEFRKEFKKPTHTIDLEKDESLFIRIRHQLAPCRAIWNWYVKPQINVLKSTGITLDYRPPRIILRDFYCEKHYKKSMKNRKYSPLEKIGKFVYLPLQFQPEASIDVIAPYFNNQIEVARQVAMSLPDDYTLVVKEHPAMIGFRPPSYIEKIARTPNVKLIDYRTPSEVVLKKADLVLSPNSTTLAEAAFYNKPGIQFGNLGTTLMLPNVFKHTDLSTLSKKIKELVETNLSTPEYEKKLENYIAATYDSSFNVDYIKIWEDGESSGSTNEQLWQVYKKEMLSNLI
jgi:hypothetical protein